eukprot:COSAG04_NODE_3957_length_2398_cov_18.926055_1_plen_66_part_00
MPGKVQIAEKCVIPLEWARLDRTRKVYAWDLGGSAPQRAAELERWRSRPTAPGQNHGGASHLGVT